MFVREVGRGSRTVLLLHGAPSPAEDLMPLAEALSADYRVLVPDLPGYGKTPGGDLSYTTTNGRLVAMLRERDAMELHGIVGYSGGVFRGLYLLLRGGVEAKHLVSLAGVAGFDDVERGTFRGFAELTRSSEHSLRDPAIIAMMGERFLSPSWREKHPDDVQRIATWLLLLSREDMAKELEAGIETEDFRPLLGQLRAKVHVRVGELDAATPVQKSRELASGARSGTLEIVPGVGHAMFIEDAPATVAWVVAALG